MARLAPAGLAHNRVVSAIPDLTTRMGLLEHRTEALRAALAETALRDGVRLLLSEHLATAEEALPVARNQIAAAERASLAADLRRVGVDHIVLSTAGRWLRTLAGELRVRGIRS